MNKTNESTFDDLPDEMVLQILSKISDLKTLCICELVSKLFYRIVLQVEAISFTSVIDPIVIPPNMELDLSVSFTLLMMPFELAMLSLKKFKRVKSLNIQLLSSPNNPLLNKWIFKFDNKLNQFVFLSANYMRGLVIVGCCSAALKFSHCWKTFPLTDLDKRRTITYNGETIIAMQNILSLPYEKFKHKHMMHKRRERTHTVLFLKLPIFGYVMTWVTLKVRERDDLRLLSTDILDDDFVGDKEEAPYNEAIKEILERCLYM
ncbi:F-box domain containing protein [Tanacetum coccineum]